MPKYNLGDANDRFTGTSLDDEIYGNGGADYISAGDGNDFVNGGIGDDAIAGGRGNDWLLGGIGTDTINGEQGNDTIRDQAGNDTYYGGADDDTIEGGFGHDRLYGEAGHDTLVLVNGDAVTMEGGTGNDTYVLGHGYASHFWEAWTLPTIIEKAGGGVDKIVLDGSWYLGYDSFTMPAQVEQIQSDVLIPVHGNELDNLMEGGVNGDILYGGPGNDTLVGGTSVNTDDPDWLFGEDGNDTLMAPPNALLRGGIGDDVYVIKSFDPEIDTFSEAGGYRIVELAGQGYDTLKANAMNITMPDQVERLMLIDFAAEIGAKAFGNAQANLMTGGAGIDELHGGGGNDRIYGAEGDDSVIGDDGDDLLSGDAGNDALSGGVGNDSLVGGIGDDELWAGPGNDRLEGGDGNDFLHGGAGADQLFGGAGADRFVFRAAGESTMFAGIDKLMDFTRGEDRIDLSSFDANPSSAGLQVFQLVGAFTGHAGELRFGSSDGGASTTFYADLNGDLAADLIVQVVGVPTLAASDFLGVAG